jgi:hypothetical protein
VVPRVALAGASVVGEVAAGTAPAGASVVGEVAAGTTLAGASVVGEVAAGAALAGADGSTLGSAVAETARAALWLGLTVATAAPEASVALPVSRASVGRATGDRPLVVDAVAPADRLAADEGSCVARLRGAGAAAVAVWRTESAAASARLLAIGALGLLLVRLTATGAALATTGAALAVAGAALATAGAALVATAAALRIAFLGATAVAATAARLPMVAAAAAWARLTATAVLAAVGDLRRAGVDEDGFREDSEDALAAGWASGRPRDGRGGTRLLMRRG